MPRNRKETLHSLLPISVYSLLPKIVYSYLLVTPHIAVAEYDLPSSLFGQFGNAEVLVVGQSLDAKLLNVILLADRAQL
jgi:hypothetical protein